MKGKMFIFGLVMLSCCAYGLQGEAQAFIIINEILADPPAGIEGDARVTQVENIK